MRKFFKSIFVLAIVLSSCSFAYKTPSQNLATEQADYLIYYAVSNWGQRELVLYDPKSDASTKILTDWIIDDFSVSVTNKLAFTTSQDGNSRVYVVDYPYSKNTPIEITPDNSKKNKPISWSPDGKIFLFESVQEDENALLLWDGKQALDIHHYPKRNYSYTWGPNGQLAFHEVYTFVFPYHGDPGEVMLWDGKNVVSVSQNPGGDDRDPAWSKDGKLAFLSEHDEEFDIFVWDGTSKVNDVPDKKTFTNVAPDLTQYYSHPTWTSSGTLAFDGSGKWDLAIQIYEWDGQSAVNISRNPIDHNGGQTWSSDGRWAFITYASDVTGLNVYVRDAKNHTILSTKGRYTPAWSQSGSLIFCVEDEPSGWILSMWDGSQVINIAHADFIKAMWPNGSYVYCSHG